ncbi:MAG: STAS domain-containing protein, partial [Actinomycetota bacterium]
SLDSSTARFLHARLDALVRSGYDEIIVDCRHLQRIDADGYAPIQRAAEILDAMGGRLTLLDLDLPVDGIEPAELPLAA